MLLTIPGLASAGTGLVDSTVAPAQQTLDDAVDAVLDPVEDVTKPVRDAAGPVAKTIDDAVDTVDETAGDTTKPVTDVVDEPTIDDGGAAGGSHPRPDPADGEGAVAGPSSVAEPRRQPARNAATAPAAPALRRTRGPTDAETASSALARNAAEPVTARPAGRTGQPDSPADGIADAVTDASRAFRFPLLLAAALLLFLAVQGRIDSRDPKLKHAGNDEDLMFA